MPNIHDEERIKGILKEICYPEEFTNGVDLQNHIYAMEVYGSLMYQKALEEAMKCVPEEMEGTAQMRDERDAFNECRQQTLDDLNKLLPTTN